MPCVVIGAVIGIVCAPSICTWIIKSMQPIFFQWWPFWLIYLCGSPNNMVQLRAFIFGSVVHLHWGCRYRRNIDLDTNFKIIYFKIINKIFDILHFFHMHIWGWKWHSSCCLPPLFTSIVGINLVNTITKWGSTVKTNKQRYVLEEPKPLIGCFNKLKRGSHQWPFLRQLSMFVLY